LCACEGVEVDRRWGRALGRKGHASMLAGLGDGLMSGRFDWVSIEFFVFTVVAVIH
jgi:hypothetical protein